MVFVTSSEPEVRAHLPDAFIVPKPLNLPELEAAVKAACKQPLTAADCTGETPPAPGDG